MIIISCCQLLCMLCILTVCRVCVVTRMLLKLFQEIYYWERLGFETPHFASEAYTKNEEQRFLRESVLLIVRDYNRCETAVIF